MGAESFLTLQIVDFAEGVDDRVAALLTAGTGITLTYNDGAGTLTIASTVSPTWGSIGGTLSSQTDLQTALNAKVNLAGDTMTGTLTAPEYRSPRAGSLSNVNPQNNIVLYGGFSGYGIGFDTNGELATVVDSTLRSRLGQHLGLGSSGQVRFNSAADTSGSWDTLILRNATGPTLETRSAGGLRVRSADGSAAGALNCASISTSAGVVVGGQLQVVGDIAYGSGSQITWATRGVLRVPATNIFRFSNTAVNAGFSFDVTTNGTAKLRNLDNSAAGALECGAITTSGPVNVGTYTVATLPSASANAGALAQVTDSSVTTNGSAVSGSGSNRVVVFSNGSTWDVVVA